MKLLITMPAIFIGFTHVASAQLCFQESEIITTLFNPNIAVVADIDQDGDLDIISTGGQTQLAKTPRILWYENDGGIVPTFTERFLGEPGFESDIFYGLRIADFNGDGYPDVFAYLDAAGPHYWFENNGSPSFGFTRRDTGWGGNPPKFFADLDGDGNTDIVQDNTLWLRYTGTGSTRFTVTNFTSSFTGAITSAFDIDRDGDLDILTNAGYWYENDGGIAPNFTPHFISANAAGQTLRPVEFGTPSPTTSVDLIGSGNIVFLNVATPASYLEITIPGAVGPLEPADVDGDDNLDVVDVNGNWHKNIIFGTLWSSQPTHPNATGSLTVRDIDGDGDPDLLKSNASEWYRNEDGSFSEQGFLGLSGISTPRMSDAYLHDLNNDGDLDAILNQEGTGVFTWFNNSTMTNTRTGARYGDLQAAADDAVDGDTLIGDPGIFECADDYNFLFGRALSLKSMGDLILPRDGMINLSASSLEAGAGFDLVAPDIFVDGSDPLGKKGLIEPSLSADTIIVKSLDVSNGSLTMNGDVVFAPDAFFNPFVYSYPIPGIKQIRSGDLDNDGDIDTIALSNTGNLSWFAQNPQAEFTRDIWDGVQQGIPSAVSESFEVGDFNNDGLLDIAGHDKGELFLFLNNGSTNGVLEPFTLQTIIAGDFFGGDIAVGDVDNDGDFDLIHGGLGSKSGGSVRLFTNNGANPPAFSSSTIYSPRFFVNHINLVDLEDDGDLDVLMAETPLLSEESGIIVLKNSGASPATFSGGAINFYPPTIPTKVYGGDFDGDNDADILVLYPGGSSPRIMLLENQHPSSGYRQRVLDQQSDIGNELALGDFDSDGDLDFITDAAVYYENTGSSPVFFRKDESNINGASGAIHAVDWNENGALNVIRSGMSWSLNREFASMNFMGSSADITGNLDVKRSQVYLPDESFVPDAEPTFFNVGGVMSIDSFSRLFPAAKEYGISGLINTGLFSIFNFINPDDTCTITGDYQQYMMEGTGEITGTLEFGLEVGGFIPRFEVQGNAALAGALVMVDYPVFDVPISGEDPLGVILEASSFVPGRDRFDVYTAPVLTLEFSDGSTKQGTVIPLYNQTEGPTSTVTLVPITLEDLLFTQSGFASDGIPNDAVLFDVTGASDGSPDGDVDLIVAIPEIPGVAPNGAVAVFQGSLNVNGFQMISASLFTGAIVDSPGSVEVGYFDNDSIPDIAFANQGTNGNNNDVHFLHMDSSSPTPLSIAPLPSFNIPATFTVSDMASDDFVTAGEGTDDLLLGVQSNGNGGGTVQTIAFGSMDWESCEVDVDDVDTVAPGRNSVAARGIAFADVVVTSPDSNTATYFVNIGDFENMIPIVIPTGTRPTEVAVEDLNGDGEPEVIVICEGNLGNQGVVTISRNLGANAFAPPVNLPLGTNDMINPRPVSLALSDVDDDGDRDLVLVSINDLGDQTVRVIRNTTVPGNGLSFASITDAPNQPAGLPLIVRSADLDGDSPMVPDDIVVLVDPVSSLARNGDGGALNSIDLSGDFCAPDMNRDGSLDFFDISGFLSKFAEGDSSADFTLDGSFDFFDISAFLEAFMIGCDF